MSSQHSSLLVRLSKIPPEVILVLLLVIVSAKILQGERRTVTRSYDRAARNWVSGESMYLTEKGVGFLYFPQAAILYAPFSQLPQPWGQIGWRCLGVALLAVSLRRLNGVTHSGDRAIHWGIVFITVLLGSSAIRNGQSTVHMTACMVLAAVCLSREQWNQATVWLMIGLAIKPLILVMVLLAGAVIPPMRKRVGVGILAVAISPFLFQRPEYVVSQYRDCFSMLESAHNLGVEAWWAQLFGMLRNAGITIASHWQTVIRVLAALVTLGMTALTYRRLPSSRAAIWLFGFSAVYILLFNPRTEHNTYCLLGPALGLFYAEEIGSRKRILAGFGLLLLAVLTVGSYEIGKFFTPEGGHAIWLAPLCCCLFGGYLVYRWREEDRENRPLALYPNCESNNSSSARAA
ncbi:MAG: DUF2029 domain-containing protein [Planctomycetaceae bacterium]|nr:DUF2029 domain-containing protein [Planctomycetaceae bacterium]